MSTQEGGVDNDRGERARRLRRRWRNGYDRSDDGGALQSETLKSNDRMRAESPDDLETRRRADEIEREIKGSR